MDAKCQQRQKLAKALRSNTKDARTWAALWPHVGECPTCRELYNRFVFAERAPYGGDAQLHVPSDAELGRLVDLTLAKAMLPSWPIRWWRSLRPTLLDAKHTYATVGAALAATAVAAVVVGVIWMPTNTERDAFTARAGGMANFAIRVLCVVPGSDAGLVVRPADELDSGIGSDIASCPADAKIGFVYKTASAGHLYVYRAEGGAWSAVVDGVESGLRLAMTDTFAPLPISFAASQIPIGESEFVFAFVLIGRPLNEDEARRVRENPWAVASDTDDMEPRGSVVRRTVRFAAAEKQ